MGDLLRQGASWLAQMRQQHCAGQVEYRRGDATQTVLATRGKTDVELADESGFGVVSAVWDFLIDAETLSVEPKPGDLIVADSRRYEVTNLSSEGCWRWSDPYRTTYRIHTRDAGAAT